MIKIEKIIDVINESLYNKDIDLIVESTFINIFYFNLN